MEQKHTTRLRAPWVVSHACPRAFGEALGAATIRSYLDPRAGGLQAISRFASRPARMWPGVGGRLHCIAPLVSHVYTETGWTPSRGYGKIKMALLYGKIKMALDLFLEPSRDLCEMILCRLAFGCHLGAARVVSLGGLLALGAPWGCLGAILGAFGVPLGWAIWSRVGAIWGHPGAV